MRCEKLSRKTKIEELLKFESEDLNERIIEARTKEEMMILASPDDSFLRPLPYSLSVKHSQQARPQVVNNLTRLGRGNRRFSPLNNGPCQAPNQSKNAFSDWHPSGCRGRKSTFQQKKINYNPNIGIYPILII